MTIPSDGTIDECSTRGFTVVLQRLAGASLLVFANKQDLPGALSVDDIRRALRLDDIKSHHSLTLACSAMTGLNLLDGIDWLVDDIAQRVLTLD
jgi:ADP-ribosylation factor-like protein 2